MRFFQLLLCILFSTTEGNQVPTRYLSSVGIPGQGIGDFSLNTGVPGKGIASPMPSTRVPGEGTVSSVSIEETQDNKNTEQSHLARRKIKVNRPIM